MALAVNTFPVAAWFELIGFAALIGAGGQGARSIVGLKKLSDAAQPIVGVEMTDLIVASRLVVSLAIGAVAAGITAATTMSPGAGLTGDQIAGLAVAGYAGADFIEGFIMRASPAPGAAAGTDAIGTGTGNQEAADAVAE